MKKTTKLRQLLQDGPLICPGIYDAFTAKITENVGFSAAYVTGYGISLTSLGMPDVGLTTMTEMHDIARKISNSVSIPIIADSDAGYGNALNVIRTVREYIQVGVAAIHLEDQVMPKRCGHVPGKMIIPIEEAVGKIRAAHETRMEMDPDFVLIGRTDALGSVGGTLDEAINRCNAFANAGADLVFVDGLRSEADLATVASKTHAPVLYNNGGISPIVSFEKLRDLGIAISIFPGLALHSIGEAWWNFLGDFKERGTAAQSDLLTRMEGHPMRNLHTFSGLPEYRKLEEAYLPDSELAIRYKEDSG